MKLIYHFPAPFAMKINGWPLVHVRRVRQTMPDARTLVSRIVTYLNICIFTLQHTCDTMYTIFK